VWVLGDGQDVVGGTRRRRGVVDRADLGHPLPVAFLTLGQAGGQLTAGLAGRRGRGRSQRVGAHHHALGVEGEHQQVTGHAQMPWPVGVEGVEIHRGALGQLLDLTLAQPLPGGPRHRGGRVGERAPRAFDRRQPAQPVGVLLCRKVQHGISRVQVGVSAVTVGHPPDPDRPEHGGQPALTVRLGALARHPVGVDHLGESGLALRPHLQMSLKQLPQQLPAVHGKPCLQHIVGQPCRFLTAQPRHHSLEATTRLAERIIRRLRRVSFHSGLLLHVLVQAPMNVGRRGPFVSPSTTPDTPATGVFGLPQQSRTQAISREST